MVTLIFDFNKEKVEAAGLTTDDLLQPMREHAKKYDIKETSYGVFQKEGENAMCVVGMFVTDITDRDHKYISYFNSWIFNVNGQIEDCVETIKRWYKKNGIMMYCSETVGV